ncbi:MAG: transposase [Proteobacteria bacterium]|nr:transposase [Pseudomonadota bacterium]
MDETAFQRRHEYVTVVNDLAGKVLYVADDRTRESLSGFYEALGGAGVVALVALGDPFATGADQTSRSNDQTTLGWCHERGHQ